MNRARNISFLILILAGMSTFGEAKVTVSLRETAGVAGDYVRLAAVAEVDGDEAQIKRVAGLYLGPVPPMGEIRRITRAQIRDRLLEVGLSGMVSLIGSDAVMISRQQPGAFSLQKENSSHPKQRAISNRQNKQNEQAKKLLTHLAGQAVRRYLEKTMQRDDLEVSISIDDIRGTMSSRVASIKVQRVITGRLPGRARLMLRAHDKSGQDLGKLEIRTQAQAFAQVLFLRRSLQRGQMLHPEDLMVRKVELRGNIAYMPLDPKALAGRQAARFLRAMSPLKHGDLEIPAAVIKGQPITVKTNSGGFGVIMRVIALGTARTGELLEVENIGSKKRFVVRVTGFGTASMPQDKPQDKRR